MTLKSKWTIRIVCGVIVVCAAAAVYSIIRNGGTNDNSETLIQEDFIQATEAPAPDIQDEEGTKVPDEQVKNTFAQTEAIEIGEDGADPYNLDPEVSGYMTREQADALSDEELAYYMDQVVWDANFQTFIESDEELHTDLYYYQKLYLQMNPDYFIPGFGNPYADADTEETVLEQFDEWAAEAQNTMYDSTPVSYVYDEEGHTITLGWSGQTDGEGIYLVPSCSNADAEHKVAFYFLENANIEAARTMFFGAAEDSFNADFNNFIVSNQTYNLLYASTYDFTEDLWHIRWTDSKRSIGQTTTSDIIYGRMIDLNTGNMLACFRAEVRYNSEDDQYYLADIYDGEAVSLGLLTTGERDAAIQKAVEYLSTDGSIAQYLPETWSADTENAIVDKLPDNTTYFDQLYGTNCVALYTSEVTYHIADVYAVNLPVTGMGNITFYFGPELQVMYALVEYEGDLPTDLNLTMFGFDALTPSSPSEILALDGYNNAF